jgi:hypothetical protein
MIIKRDLFWSLILGIIALACLEHPSTAMDKGEPSRTAKGEPIGPHVNDLMAADPKRDFTIARNKGDIYFLAVRGVTVMIPGVEPSHRHLVDRVGKKIIQGTSDVVPNERARELRRNALVYAERYNRLVLQFLSQNKRK